MRMFGHSQCTIRYVCEWENETHTERESSLCSYLYALLENCLFQRDEFQKVNQYVLGTFSNEKEGLLILQSYRYHDSNHLYWKFTWMKCFDVCSEFLNEELDGLYHSVPSTVIPFKHYYHQGMLKNIQVLGSVRFCVSFSDQRTVRCYPMADKMTQLTLQFQSTHFPGILWTYDQLFDHPVSFWSFPILSSGSFIHRSQWIRPHWVKCQTYMDRLWKDFQVFRNQNYQHWHVSNRSNVDFYHFQVDNFIDCKGVGLTFLWTAWNWTFQKCFVALYLRQRTRVEWGTHPIQSCLDQRSEDDLMLRPSEQLVLRITFQQNGHRPCDTFVFEATMTEVLRKFREDRTNRFTLSDIRSSLIWVFGHALEQALMRYAENVVMDGLGSGSQYCSPFDYMDRLNQVYDILKTPDVECKPFHFPQPADHLFF
jgi:hypothetical protein